MSDLIERLRSRAWEHRHHRKYREEAADELERLRAELAAAQQMAEPISKVYTNVEDLIADLHAMCAAEPLGYMQQRVDMKTLKTVMVFGPWNERPESEVTPLYLQPRITAEQVERIKRLAQDVNDASWEAALHSVNYYKPSDLGKAEAELKSAEAALHSALDALLREYTPKEKRDE